MSNLPPSGEIPRGAIRFNTDSNKPELWDGSQWAEFQLSTPNLGQGSDTQPGARGINGGGTAASPVNRTNVIDYINIASLGDAIEFGHLVTSGYSGPMFSNAVRGIKGGVNDYDGASHWTKNIEYLTIATTGSSEYFGDLTVARYGGSGSSSQTRGVFSMGAESPGTNTNIIDYVQIASTGNAVDFGDDLFTGRYSAGFSDSHGGLGGF